MRINRTCKICGKNYQAIKGTQFFCSRKCFKKDYYLRTKAKLQDQEQYPTYPTKRCAFCDVSTTLKFDPLEQPQLFDTWMCPECGVPNMLVWKYQNSPSSHQMISEVLSEMKAMATGPVTVEIQYQTYQIPVARLEHGSPSILVMTCETLHMTDIQKQDRKKILFS
ncbi:MAG: hypothetical protein NUV96_01720 [Candidatus Colwellbacteria bacterium]|nr:hypothetical protein [Candidatus Colwellbacteria bacterium]